MINHANHKLDEHKKINENKELQFSHKSLQTFDIKASPILIFLAQKQQKFLYLIDQKGRYWRKMVQEDNNSGSQRRLNNLSKFSSLFKKFCGKECANCRKSSKEVELFKCPRCNSI